MEKLALTGISLGFGCLTCPRAGQKWRAALRYCHHHKIKITQTQELKTVK